MILVEVVQLVVDIDWCRNSLLDFDLDRAIAIEVLLALREVIVGQHLLANLVAHHVKQNAKAQEDDAEYGESDHSGAERWDGAPGGERLLLEVRLTQLVNLVEDLLALLFVDIHVCLFFKYVTL